MLAASKIRQLLVSNNNLLIQEILRRNWIPLLLSWLVEGAELPLQIGALWALTNIAAGPPEHTHTLIRHGSIPILLGLLTSDNDEILEQSVWVLGNIAGEGVSSRDAILAAGTVNPLVECLSEHPNSQPLMKIGAWALSNICDGQPRRLVDISNLAPLLATMLHQTDPEVLSHTCWALSHLCDGPPTHLRTMLNSMPTLCARLVELLSHRSWKIVKPALRTIGNIVCAEDDVDYTEIVTEAGAVQSLCGLVSHSNRDIQKEACWTLSNIAAGTVCQIQRVIDSGIMSQIVEIARAPDTDHEVRSEASWVVLNASSCGSDKQIEQLIETGSVGVLNDMLSDSSMRLMALEGIERVLAIGDSKVQRRIDGNKTLKGNPYAYLLSVENIESLYNVNKTTTLGKRLGKIFREHFLACAICSKYYHKESETLKYCEECKGHVCSNCDCRRYHLSYQEVVWGEIESLEDNMKNAKKASKKQKKKKQKAKQKGKKTANDIERDDEKEEDKKDCKADESVVSGRSENPAKLEVKSAPSEVIEKEVSKPTTPGGVWGNPPSILRSTALAAPVQEEEFTAVRGRRKGSKSSSSTRERNESQGSTRSPGISLVDAFPPYPQGPGNSSTLSTAPSNSTPGGRYADVLLNAHSEPVPSNQSPMDFPPLAAPSPTTQKQSSTSVSSATTSAVKKSRSQLKKESKALKSAQAASEAAAMSYATIAAAARSAALNSSSQTSPIHSHSKSPVAQAQSKSIPQSAGQGQVKGGSDLQVQDKDITPLPQPAKIDSHPAVPPGSRATPSQLKSTRGTAQPEIAAPSKPSQKSSTAEAEPQPLSEPQNKVNRSTRSLVAQIASPAVQDNDLGGQSQVRCDKSVNIAESPSGVTAPSQAVPEEPNAPTSVCPPDTDAPHVIPYLGLGDDSSFSLGHLPMSAAPAVEPLSNLLPNPSTSYTSSHAPDMTIPITNQTPAYTLSRSPLVSPENHPSGPHATPSATAPMQSSSMYVDSSYDDDQDYLHTRHAEMLLGDDDDDIRYSGSESAEL
eukprot:CAMPEP_0185028398 /NCGR_PEP_ID=MMETSP1103-20130426/14054_1 /TAXON_ID=36769 /ORGANISM="Paraphysomonas bandaiensis, Strain Caron Lab Isolate" /LENGTH=1026 /DNA_ID=CAMNT_0027562797 /DNA_START=160 /DNA_END=3237 /DNA_ORIENTATION=-